MLQVTNRTNDQPLVENGRLANHFLARLRGLLGVRELPRGDGLLIEGINCIHTHFMAIPIDVVYLDETYAVVDVDEKLPPWRFGRLRRRARHVLELPAGSIEATGLVVGDRLAVVK